VVAVKLIPTCAADWPAKGCFLSFFGLRIGSKIATVPTKTQAV
jgi:hypothetical protein